MSTRAQELWHQEDAKEWLVRSTSEVYPVAEAVTRAMAALGYPEKDVFGVHLAMEEAIVNAIKHGHRYDATKSVRVRCQVDAEQVLLEVEDQGPGFDPREVRDPLTPENQERDSGRGLFLMRAYTSSTHYNERGNCVTLRRCRSLPGQAA